MDHTVVLSGILVTSYCIVSKIKSIYNSTNLNWIETFKISALEKFIRSPQDFAEKTYAGRKFFFVLKGTSNAYVRIYAHPSSRLSFGGTLKNEGRLDFVYLSFRLSSLFLYLQDCSLFLSVSLAIFLYRFRSFFLICLVLLDSIWSSQLHHFSTERGSSSVFNLFRIFLKDRVRAHFHRKKNTQR